MIDEHVTSRPGDSTVMEWDYLHSDHLWFFAVLLAIAGALTPVAEWVDLTMWQIDLLGLMLCGVAIVAVGLARTRPLLTSLLMVGVTFLVPALYIAWRPSAVVLALYAIPVSLSRLLMPRWGSNAAALAAIGLLWTSPVPAAEAKAIVSLAVGIIWLVGWLSDAYRQGLLDTLLAYYGTANAALENARDHQLALNQANDSLLKTYTRLARLNDQLHASRLEADLARRAKEQFVANVSHELRTPLNMIIGFSELLHRAAITYGTPLPEELLADLGVIQRNSWHLAQLIDDVLDLSQLEVGQMSLRREPVIVAELLAEAVDAVRPLFQAKGLTLITNVPQDIQLVFWDRLRVRQVLLNILSNAGRFTVIGGVDVHVAASAHQVCFSISDTGPGIAPNDQHRIFEPFEQVDGSTARESSGTGLGLSISKRLVELHGGRLWLESHLGKGSTFHVALPQREVQPASADVSRWVNPYTAYEPTVHPPASPLPKPKPRAIVVDEGHVLHHQAEVYLQNMEVKRVTSLEALNVEIQQMPPHLVIVNNHQVMEGGKSLRALFQLPPRTPIVSCYVPGLREACEQLNVSEYLLKPVAETALLTTVARITQPGATVLLVEDDAEAARLLTRQLTAADGGYRLLRATNGRRALDLMRTRRPNAVLLDLGLPHLDGYEVLAEKNADSTICEIPTAIVSARDPLGAPVLASRIRVELSGGLSGRDIILAAAAITRSLSPESRLAGPALPATPAG